MYFDCLPAEVFPTIVKYVFVRTDSQEKEELEGSMSTLSKRTKHILNLIMLLSDDSPFREAVSQLQLREVMLGPIFDASRLWMDNGILLVRPEFFKNESLKLEIALFKSNRNCWRSAERKFYKFIWVRDYRSAS